ncbi:uncharacterized protein [Antedon mediterranea]|uniref:uncharacterized protein n=1 Tax=Antedon mediterranea TaxID=105859 RepID=UPI003AF8316D
MSTNRPNKKGPQKDGNTEGTNYVLRRKLNFDCKPLNGKIFYFDLIKYKHSAKLQKDIITLGGKVEEFLSNGIHYVITNRPEGRELEKRGSVAGTSAESPSVSTPSPFQQGKGSSKDATDSPSALAAEKNSSSRGKAIASRALPSQHLGVVSILTQAIQWGVQVKHLDSVLKYIKRELGTSPATEHKSKTSTERLSSTSKSTSGVFIKVEDRNSHYRPISKSLEVWPRVSTDTPIGSCPYDGAAFKSRHQQDKHKSRNKKPSITKDIAKGKGLTLIQVRKKNAEKMKERKKGFCECCKQRFDNLDKHLSSSEHRDFVSKQNHYSALDQMITQGPDIAAFLEDVIRFHADQKQDALSLHPEIVERNKETTATNLSDLPGQSGSSRLQRENSLRVSLPLEHAQPKRLASQRSPEVVNEKEMDSSRVEEVFQEMWLGEPPLRSASEVDVNEFIKHRTAMQKRNANSNKKKLKTSGTLQNIGTVTTDKPTNNSQELNECKTSPNKKCTSHSQEKKQPKSPLVSPLIIQRKSVKRSFDDKETGDGSDTMSYKIKEKPKKRRKTVAEEEDDDVFKEDFANKSPKLVTTTSKRKLQKAAESSVLMKSDKFVTTPTSQQNQTKPTDSCIIEDFDKICTPDMSKKKSKIAEESNIPDKSNKVGTLQSSKQKEKKVGIPDKSNKIDTPPSTKGKETKKSCIPVEEKSPRKSSSSPHGETSSKDGRRNLRKTAINLPNNMTKKNVTTRSEKKKEKKQPSNTREAKGLLNRVLANKQRGKRKKGSKVLNRTFDATLSVEHIFSSDLGGSEFLGFRSEDIRESELNLQLRINESICKVPLTDAALEVTCVKCDDEGHEEDSDVRSSSRDLAIQCVFHTVDNFSQGESDWDRQVDGYMSKLDTIDNRRKTEKDTLKLDNTKPENGTNVSPTLKSSSPHKRSQTTPNQVSRAFITEILERRQHGYQRTTVEDLFPDVKVKHRDILFDSSAEDIENLPIPNVVNQEQKVSPQSKSKSPNKQRKCPPSPLKMLRPQSSGEPHPVVSPVSPGLSVRNENVPDDMFVDSPSKHLPPGSKLRERSKSAEPKTPRTPCKTQRCMFSTPEQKDKIWLVKSPGFCASPPMIQLPPGTPQEEVELIEDNYVHDETEIEIIFPKFSSPMRTGTIKTPVKHIADPQTGRPLPSPVKSKPSTDTDLSSVISLNKALSLSPIKMNVAVYVPDFAKEGFARNLFGSSKKSTSAKAKRSPAATSNAIVSPNKPFTLFYDKHSSTPTSATFRARTKVISPIFSAYKKPRFSLNLLKPPKMKYAKSGRRTRNQLKEEQEDLLRRLSLSQFINKSNNEQESDELNESLDAVYDFEEEAVNTSSDSNASKGVQTNSTKSAKGKSQKKSINKKRKVAASRSSQRRTRSESKRNSVCSSSQEVSSVVMEELCSEGFFC